MRRINSDTKIKSNPDIIDKKINKKLYLYNPESGRTHGLNETASLIWKMAVKGCKVREIIKLFTKEFTVERKTAEKDIFEFIEKYIESNFIKILP